MSLTLWKNIYDNCKDLIESNINGELNIQLKQNEKTIDLFTQPISLFNGSYSLKYGTINEYSFTVAKIIDYNVNVIMQVSYEINKNDIINSYNDMIGDIEQIISYRLNYDYFGTDILLCSLVNAPAPVDIETSSFVVWELIFNITGRVTL